MAPRQAMTGRSCDTSAWHIYDRCSFHCVFETIVRLVERLRDFIECERVRVVDTAYGMARAHIPSKREEEAETCLGRELPAATRDCPVWPLQEPTNLPDEWMARRIMPSKTYKQKTNSRQDHRETATIPAAALLTTEACERGDTRLSPSQHFLSQSKKSVSIETRTHTRARTHTHTHHSTNTKAHTPKHTHTQHGTSSPPPQKKQRSLCDRPISHLARGQARPALAQREGRAVRAGAHGPVHHHPLHGVTWCVVVAWATNLSQNKHSKAMQRA